MPSRYFSNMPTLPNAILSTPQRPNYHPLSHQPRVPTSPYAYKFSGPAGPYESHNVRRNIFTFYVVAPMLTCRVKSFTARTSSTSANNDDNNTLPPLQYPICPRDTSRDAETWSEPPPSPTFSERHKTCFIVSTRCYPLEERL